MSTVNPYLIAHRITIKRQGRSWLTLLILFGAVVAAPLAEPVLLHFIRSGEVDGAGVEQLALRLGALVAGIMSLRTYSDIVRSPESGIIALHPLLPTCFLQAVTIRTLKDSACWPLALSIVIAPMIWQDAFIAWSLMVAIILSSWLGGIGVGYAVNLGSIWVARNESSSQWLDLVRGSNPREQAAFIYAPGCALAILGIAIALACGGARAVLAGKEAFGILILSPVLLGGIGFWWARSLVNKELVRGIAILEEIDAHWKQVSEEEESNAVYLDWLIKDHPERLRALRQGWRSYRIYPNLSWVCGALSGLALWGDQPEQAVMLSTLGIVCLGVLPSRLAEGDPVWLDRSLGISQWKVLWARASVTFLYSIGIWIPLACIAILKQEKGMLPTLLALCLLSGVVSVFGSFLAYRWRAKGYGYYIPCAVILWALTLRMIA